MLLAAKTVAPCSVVFAPWREILAKACAHGATTITAPTGSLLPEALATTLRAQRGEPLWVTLGPEDHDLAVLLYSLLTAAQRLNPTIGAQTTAALTQSAGLHDAWPAIFQVFAEELACTLPEHCVLVLEHAEQLNAASVTLGLLSNYILSRLIGAHPWIVITRQELPRPALPRETVTYNAFSLRINPAEIQELATSVGCYLPNSVLRRAGTLLAGGAGNLYSFFRMAGRLGETTTTTLIERSSGAEQLLGHIARAVYGMDSPSGHAALDFSRRLGYTHPDLSGTNFGYCTPDSVWLLPLADGWQRLRDVWQTILPRLLRPGEQASNDALTCAADTFVDQGALIPAVDLYQELGAHEQAATVINSALDRMMRLGQWRTLGRWLERTPTPILHAWPWLLYTQNEIAAAQQDFAQARRGFAAATTSFTLHNDAVGACQSLLAESTLALWQGDAQQAHQRTRAALAHAETAGLAWHMGWAAWQLVELALSDGNLAGAMIYLERALQAAAAADEQQLGTILGQVNLLLSQRRTLGERREEHRQAYFAVEQAEQTLHERLHQLFAAPLSINEQLLSLRPWTATPLMLKLPAPAFAPPTEPTARPRIWQELLRRFGFTRVEGPEAATPPTVPPPLEGSANLFTLVDDSSSPQITAPERMIAPRSEPQLATNAGDADRQATPLNLIAYVLGAFRISLNDDPIVNWPSGRGRALLKYLLVHHDHPTPRDVLMDLLWPEASPEDARNSLNVAMHGLRQAFRSVTDQPIVLFQRDDATYRLNPDLALWLDIGEFERLVATGRQHEESGLFSAAVAGYEQAASLYQGDFMAEDPYEDWPMLQREQLRLAYLDMLERLGQIYFSQGQYGACATLCQQILARDNCREDAHCRLMRCYSRQSQHHMALRQYQSCIKALADELGVEPLPSTIRLADQIRRHEYV